MCVYAEILIDLINFGDIHPSYFINVVFMHTLPKFLSSNVRALGIINIMSACLISFICCSYVFITMII